MLYTLTIIITGLTTGVTVAETSDYRHPSLSACESQGRLEASRLQGAGTRGGYHFRVSHKCTGVS